jgi:hypothetical protein
MTREEEIRQEIDLQLAGCFGNYSEGYEEGFIAGAKWADKTMIDKFCKWIESTDIDMKYWNSEDGVCKELLINDIKKQWNYEIVDCERTKW